MKINKKFENYLGIVMVSLIFGLIIFSFGYTIITEGIFSVGSQSRYFDYQDL